MTPFVVRLQGEHSWERWMVAMRGKKPAWFEHWYAAVAHAVYVSRNPVAMEDAA